MPAKLIPEKFITDNGTIQYMYDGKRHREDGPAVISPACLLEAWYFHGQLHRLDGPAVIKDDFIAWMQNDEFHREDGPAIIDAGKFDWYLRGTSYSQEQYWQKQKDTAHAPKIFAYIFGDQSTIDEPAE